MNNYEQQMLDILKLGQEKFGIISVKAEFEAEGTRVDELQRLLEIARKAELKVGIKIGGCEAVRDLIECRLYGADYIIAPMVETPYALTKYIAAKDKFYPAQEQKSVDFLFNVETHATYEQVEEMGEVAAKGGVGMVFGRVDFVGSMGKARDFVNTDNMVNYVSKVATVARKHDLDLVVGGGVSPEAIPALRRIRQIRLDRFETRKVIFDASILDGEDATSAMELAIEFELLWLKNKHEYYSTIAAEDLQRIGMMEARQRAKAA